MEMIIIRQIGAREVVRIFMSTHIMKVMMIIRGEFYVVNKN